MIKIPQLSLPSCHRSIGSDTEDEKDEEIHETANTSIMRGEIIQLKYI